MPMSKDRTASPIDSNVTIRLAKPAELAALQDIEERAADRFAAFPELAIDDVAPHPLAKLEKALNEQLLWVAGVDPTGGDPDAPSEIVGFAFAKLIDGALHLAEVDVLTPWGRRGIGRALIERAVEAGRLRNSPYVSLTTFRHVPWNGPLYERLGFRHLAADAWTPELRALVEAEDAAGLPRDLRTVMVFDLTTAPKTAQVPP